MLDPKFLRNELQQTAQRLASRGYILDVELLNQLEEKRKTLQVTTESLQADRNSRSKEIGEAAKRGEDITQIRAEMNVLGEDLERAKEDFALLAEQIKQIAYNMPNLPHESAPVGKDESENVEVLKWG
ncbi:MAG: serine--tRNA ligase, partial [Psychromonas sp.]